MVHYGATLTFRWISSSQTHEIMRRISACISRSTWLLTTSVEDCSSSNFNTPVYMCTCCISPDSVAMEAAHQAEVVLPPAHGGLGVLHHLHHCTCSVTAEENTSTGRTSCHAHLHHGNYYHDPWILLCAVTNWLNITHQLHWEYLVDTFLLRAPLHKHEQTSVSLASHVVLQAKWSQGRQTWEGLHVCVIIIIIAQRQLVHIWQWK